MTPEEQEALAFRLQQLGQAEAFLEAGVKSGQVPKKAYHKGMVAIAHDLVVEHHHNGKAIELLMRCDPEYFKSEQLQDMAEDPGYAQAVVQLGTALVALGLVSQTPQPAFTQPLGVA